MRKRRSTRSTHSARGCPTTATSFGEQSYTISAHDLHNGGNLSISATVTVQGDTATAKPLRSVLLFLSREASADAVGGLPPRIEWLGDFTKLRSFDGGKATAHLMLGADALSRWVPTAGGAESKSFTAGSYLVQTGEYTLRLTDSTATAKLSVT